MSIGESGIRTHLSKVKEEERKQFRVKKGKAGESRGHGPDDTDFSMCYPKKPETRGSPSPFTDGFTEGFVQSQEQVA